MISYVAIALNIIAGILYTPWMINQIGQSRYGLYTLAQSVITLFLIDFGLGTAVSRYISKYRAEGDSEKEANFLGMIYKLYIGIDALIMVALLVVYLLLEHIYVKLTPAELEQLRVVFVITGLFSIVNFPLVTLNGVLNAHEKFIQLKTADILSRVIDITLVVIALSLGYGLYALVAIHAITGLLSSAAKLAFVCRIPGFRVRLQFWDDALAKKVAAFSVWVTIAALASRLVFNISPSILGIVSNSTEIALFGVITTIEQYSYTITSAINGMFIPKLSRIYTADNDRVDITPLVLDVGRYQFALNGLIIVGFSLIGRPFLGLWMGEAYLGTYAGILLVIIPGLFFNSLEIVNNALVVQKKVNIQAALTIVTGVTNIAFSFLLSYFWGAIGACLSIFIAYCIRAVLMHVIAHRVMHVQIGEIVRKCYLRFGIPIVLTLAAGFACRVERLCTSWLTLIGVGCAIVVLYAVLVVVISLTKEEKQSILSKIRNHA